MEDGGELLRGLADLWPKIFPYVLSFGVLGLRWLANVEVRTRAEFVNREYVNGWLLYLLLITCVPFTTVVVGGFAQYTAHALLISAVGHRLVLVTPHPEQGDHPSRRQMSAVLLMVSSLLAIALSFVNSRVALRALALNFAAPLLKKWGGRAALSD